MTKQDNKPKNFINFENIYVSYDSSPVLENINLKINSDEHWVVLGANGSGKSTLIKLFSNDLYPNTRYPFKKTIFGKERWNIFELKNDLGIITSDLHTRYAFYGKYSTAYDVVLSGYYSSVGIVKHHVFSKEQFKKGLEVLDFLEISDIKNKNVSQMSTGELRRCIVGRALINDPKVFILDEPTVGLDIKAQNSFIKLIQKLATKTSIVLVTHHIEEIFEEITHVALMHNKTIFKQGKKEDILSSKNLSEIFEIDIDLQKENGRYYIKSIKE